jgi:hypothetical protein
VLAEEARAAALKLGGAADLDRVVRVQGAADRATHRLGIKAGAELKPPSLKDYLAAREGPSTPRPATAEPSKRQRSRRTNEPPIRVEWSRVNGSRVRHLKN